MNGPNDTYTCRILSRVLISENSQIFNSTLNLFSSGHQVKEIIFEMRPDLDLKFINNSINCVTQQNIQNVLAPTSINTDTEVVIYNAIYCKGRFSESWFDLNISDDSDQENEKNGSTLKGKKATESRLDVYVMEIPFKQNKISTFFFFPSDSSRYKKNDCTENEKIMQIIEQMTTEEGSQKLRNVLDCGVAERSYMTFPIFKIEQSLRMYELLDKLGLSELTAYGSAILHEFSNKTLKLGDALHRINIEVTMEGVTAAACDLFFSDNDCQHAKINDSTSDNLFPCICLIYDKCNRNILFCGALFDS
ncbi:serpin B5-like [Monomorium pharaonis]|uniref:serpin B5-like n=1 Tax=Monomorium pharaonis TaxID=307658 RepID=UPI0017472C07|nr:serpin B5-like [Monomorium pharaonis]